jgi:hypothetical protein
LEDTTAASQTSAATTSRSRGSRMCVCCVMWVGLRWRRAWVLMIHVR